MRRFRVAIFFAVLLCVLTGIAYWDEWKTKKEDEEEAGKNALIAFDPGSVTKIDFESVDEGKDVRFQLSKVGEEWRLSEPVKAKAQAAHVDNFLKSLADYKYSQVVAETREKWDEYGLKSPQRSITLYFGKDGNEKKSIFVGSKSAIGFNAYSRTSDNERTLIGSQVLLTQTAKTAKDFRSRKIVEFDPEKVSKVVLERKGKTPIEVTKDTKGYLISKPVSIKADEETIDAFLSSIAGLEATEFVDAPSEDQQADFSNTKQFAKVQIFSAAETQPITIKFSTDKKNLWASLDPASVIFKIDESFRDELSKNTFDFQDRRLFEFSPTEVTQIEVDGVAFDKLKGEWFSQETPTISPIPRGSSSSAASPTPAPSVVAAPSPIPQPHIGSLIESLSNLRATAILPASDKSAKKYISMTPIRRISVKLHKDALTSVYTMKIWRRGDDKRHVLAQVSPKEEIFEIDKSILATMDGTKPEEPEAAKEEALDIPDDTHDDHDGHDHGPSMPLGD